MSRASAADTPMAGIAVPGFMAADARDMAAYLYAQP